MPKFAILNNNIVSDIIIADVLEDTFILGTAVEYTDENPAIIGSTYDPETKKYILKNKEEVTNA